MTRAIEGRALRCAHACTCATACRCTLSLRSWSFRALGYAATRMCACILHLRVLPSYSATTDPCTLSGGMRRSELLTAGVMACPEGTTEDGFETQLGTNHLAHFLLFVELRDVLLQSSTPERASRVVCVSSGLHRNRTVVFDDLDFSKEEYKPV